MNPTSGEKVKKNKKKKTRRMEEQNIESQKQSLFRVR